MDVGNFGFVVAGLIVGFIAVELGLMVGPKEKPKDSQTATQ